MGVNCFEWFFVVEKTARIVYNIFKDVSSDGTKETPFQKEIPESEI